MSTNFFAEAFTGWSEKQAKPNNSHIKTVISQHFR
ncbi:protein of unknown function [Pseudorhizobium banfieldiae]|uniref:Uncharacterized protein n=1 Tax=Pseudorhizobium banfieldiae TaxID=1125847 RepID=L0NC79_9HYPH|nr:protein of unknown function [Pseudorhizobium banfieldiae]